MNQELETAIKFEEANDFDGAFQIYRNLYSKSKKEYENWKYFYFFLWIAIEDGTEEFIEKINLRELLKKMFEDGKCQFSDFPDFNFIAGYTVSIFPYEIGNYENLEIESKEMLRKAHHLEPENLIYKIAYLGSLDNCDDSEYGKTKVEAAPKVLEQFSGEGLLNKYFRQVLYRIDKQDCR
jgi:hypothetical protein